MIKLVQMSQSYYTGETIFSAGGVLLNDLNQRIYLIYKKESDEWLLPKGHIDEGETIEETAKREIFEETGYHSEIKKLLSVQVRPDVKEPNRNKIIFWFMAILNDEIQAIDTQMEDEDFAGKWFTKEEAIGKLKWEEDKKLVECCFNK
ncbi:MAG TPA: NUDIX domain-containing protein [Spirochaetia bacterium]|nr:NUDIX domain-containing protein [Spirochaetia bacterium]